MQPWGQKTLDCWLPELADKKGYLSKYHPCAAESQKLIEHLWGLSSGHGSQVEDTTKYTLPANESL